MINSVTFEYFFLVPDFGIRFTMTELIAGMIVMVQQRDTSASCDESGMGELAVKLGG